MVDVAVYSSKIIITKRNKTIFVPINKILYIERINQCSYIVCKHDLIPVRTSLKYFESILPSKFR